MRSDRPSYLFCESTTMHAEVTLADATVRSLPLDVSPEDLAAMLTRAGGESVDHEEGERHGKYTPGEPRLRWDRIVALLILTAAFLLLAFRRRPPEKLTKEAEDDAEDSTPEP